MQHKQFSKSLIDRKLQLISSMEVKWGEAGGAFLAIEVLMRYLAELSQPLQSKLAEITTNERYKNYWDCSPKHLVQGIIEVFEEHLSSEEKVKLENFPTQRGKFLHGNSVEFLQTMKKNTGRTTQYGKTHPKELHPGEIVEGLLSIERNRGFEDLRQYSKMVLGILQRIILGLGTI